jgi:tetratricopeptide (TPR) repeat protein
MGGGKTKKASFKDLMAGMKPIHWALLGLSVAVLVTIVWWLGSADRPPERVDIVEPESQTTPPVFERKDIEAMDLSELAAYIKACESARDFQECEQAYQRAISLTQDEASRFEEFIGFKFGLANLYLNSLWEYGQFGGTGELPPALTRALKIYDEIITSYPDSDAAAEAQFGKGVVFHNELSGYWNSIHTGDAIREFQKVIDHYPGTDQAKRAEQVLLALREEPSHHGVE